MPTDRVDGDPTEPMRPPSTRRIVRGAMVGQYRLIVGPATDIIVYSWIRELDGKRRRFDCLRTAIGQLQQGTPAVRSSSSMPTDRRPA